MSSLKTFPDCREFEHSAEYLLAINKWFHDTKTELQTEHLWCEAKIGNPTSSKTENDYYRGYMQCLDRILKGIMPTEIKRSLK